MNYLPIFLTILNIIFIKIYAQNEDDFYSPTITFDPCPKNDSHLNRCLKNWIQNLFPQLINGSSDLNVPKIDPFEIPEKRYRMISGAFYGTFIPKGVQVYGMGNTKIKNVRTEFNENEVTIELDTFNPKIFINGSYKGDVKIDYIKSQPKGIFNVTLTDVRNIYKIFANFNYINGEKYLKVREVHYIPVIRDFEFYANGIYPDTETNDVFVKFINMYWRDMHKILLDDTKYLWEPIFLGTINQFLYYVPFKQIISEIN